MVDRRIGRTGGPQEMKGVQRRPEFRDADGVASEADNASDASGRIRGDLRGMPASEPPGDTYASARHAEAEGVQEPYTDDIRTSRTSAREIRQTEDREFSEDRALTDDERVEMVRRGYFQTALPDLPEKSGVHRMWLTTTNPRDPVSARLRMGYRLLKLEDLGPGWEQQKATSGEHAGCVTINEMIAAEISMSLYQRYMRELHHVMPRETERGIYGRLEARNEELVSKGSRLLMEGEGEESGFHNFGAFVRPPKEFQ